MDLDALLVETRHEVLDEVCTALRRSHVRHYESAGETVTRDGVAELFDHVVAAIRSRELGPLSRYAERMATERFDQGFEISEVQTAFNALEESMWRRVVDAVPPAVLVEAVGLLSTVLGYGKDVLARTYVSLASQRHVPSLDLSALFAGA